MCLSLCCSHVLARSLTCPRSLAPSGGYIICCCALPFPPLFGLSSARLSSSFRRPASKANCCWRAFTSSIHIILTAPQLIASPPLLFPSATYICATTSSTLCSNTRTTISTTQSEHTRRIPTRLVHCLCSVSRSSLTHPRPVYYTTLNMADAADEDLFADL